MARDLSYGVLALCLFAVLAVAGSTAPSEIGTDGADFGAFLPRVEARRHPTPVKREAAAPCKTLDDLEAAAGL